MFEFASVSVIIPCYRCGDTIERAVASVAKQTLKPFEVILVDDASGDGTLQALYRIKSCYNESWIKVVSCTKNRGAAAARNIGWQHATQNYVAFLDSDDSWHEQKIEIQYNWMLLHPDVSLSGHACKYFNEQADVYQDINIDISNPFSQVTKTSLSLSNRFPTPSVMLIRDVDHRFVDGQRNGEDYHLWLEMCFSGLKCHYTKQQLAYLHKASYGESGLSAQLWRMERGELAAYKNLYANCFIGPVRFSVLFAWSLFKYSVRIIRINTKKVFKGR
ncbi:hypothetical protein LCGC14_0323950 [marine sediment metagenome]|uniref:Glycosyltransferase 2-like domain-containing protein n=1 Tax=marine sediment metagenome TaxID=412755 RepID=A0A0F9TNX1_9ZZZZ|nr:glycosyltransferase family 2 protein [Halomonas sp.]HEB04755.1 glycosyltransferase family 2 protein [Halomonas sp.]